MNGILQIDAAVNLRSTYVLFMLCLLPNPLLAADSAANFDFFERRIRPVLAQRCFQCHSEKARRAKKLKGGLRLDRRAAALKGGDSGPVIIPGKPEKSLLLKAIKYEGDLQMPPNRRLAKRIVADFQKWIQQGADWPVSSKASTTHKEKKRGMKDYAYWRESHWAWRPIGDPPIPRIHEDSWSNNAIDKFVLARMTRGGLKPAAQADRITLYRRLHYDLLGLPPTYAEVRTFSEDTRPGAYQRTVDRLLAKPGFGEKWGRHWLDVARYADNGGFNSQTPELYTEFHFAYTYRDYVVRSINEDLPYDRFIMEQLAADQLKLGEDNRALAALGFLTLGDKSFGISLHDRIDDCIDAVSRGLMAITVSCARCHDHKYDPIPTADYYSLYSVFRNSEIDLAARRHDLRKCNIYPPLFRTRLERAQFEQRVKQTKQRQRQLRRRVRQSVSDHAQKRSMDYLLNAAGFANRKQRSGLQRSISKRWTTLLTTNQKHPVLAPWILIKRLGRKATAAQIKVMLKGISGKSAKQVNPLVRSELNKRNPQSVVEVAEVYRQLLTTMIKQAQTTGGPSKLSKPKQEIVKLFTQKGSPVLFTVREYLKFATRQQRAEMGQASKLARDTEFGHPRAIVANDRKRMSEGFVFLRGNPGKRGPLVGRRFLSLLAEKPQPFQQGSGRLDLARAITNPKNPLTARVIVNRVWQQYFGVGLVRSTGDFGTRSDVPSHPKLLDYLATRLVQEGWSLKKLHRRILLSSTFQQSSAKRSGSAEKDPDNRLLSKMNRRRLSFEELRDSLLASSNNLNRQIAGYPVKTWKSNRRTLYGYIDRYRIAIGYEMFDFPYPGRTAVKRSQTLIPQQSLFLMNSPFVRRQATRVSQTAVGLSSDSQRIAAVFERILARQPTSSEADAARAYVSDAKTKVESAWRQLSQALLLSNEYMYVD